MPRLRKYGFISALLAVFALLGGCSDGSDGETGVDGPDTPPPAMEVTSVNVNVDTPTVLETGQIAMRFFVSNQDDEAVIGLMGARVIASQLLPAGFTGAGNPSEWAYLGAETCAVEESCAGQWTDLTNGFYQYETAFSVNDASGVSYDPEATLRLVVKVGGDTLIDGVTEVPVKNAFNDFSPANDVPLYGRQLVAIDSCNACHTELTFHGGNYTEVETCASCHTENRLSNPENVLSGLAHSVHTSSNLAEFANCESCHDPDNGLANNLDWTLKPNALACGACHSNIDFAAGVGHSTQTDNSNCVACHSPDWTRDAHLNPQSRTALDQFAVELNSVAPDLATGTLDLVISVSDPVSGTPYESPDQLAFVDVLRYYANWGTSFDYSARIGPSVRMNEVAPAETVAPGQYRYTITGLTVPTGTETDGGVIALQGRLCHSDGTLVACDTDGASEISIRSVTQFFDATGLSDEKAHRTVVTNESCGSCHGDQQLNFHGTRNELEQQCQVCHNANMEADATAANPAATNANYSHMVHAIHSSARPGYEALEYPAPLTDCRQCHVQNEGADSFALPLLDSIPPMRLDDGSFTSVAAATCSVCHGDEAALAHMASPSNGGVFGGTEEAASSLETCSVCHGAGREFDIAVSHGLQ